MICCCSSSTVWIADTLSQMSEVYICQICLDINGVGLDVVSSFCYVSNCIRGGGE